MNKNSASKFHAGGTYHCDYCRAELTGPPVGTSLNDVNPYTYIRVRCAECMDYDLCLNCYSHKRYTYPHSPTHNYKVHRPLVENMFEAGWQADEELLLLESIELYGFGNWSDCATYVGTKSAKRCQVHYERVYMNSQYAPLPDMYRLLDASVIDDSDEVEADSKAVGKLKGAKNKIKSKSAKNSLSNVQQLQRANSNSSINSSATMGNQSVVNVVENKPPRWQTSILKPKSGIASIVGLTPNRGDFDNEYMNDAELFVCELEMNDNNSPLEIQRKLALLDVYNNVLDARIERKQLILKHDLFDKWDKPPARSKHEAATYEQFKLYLRFMSTPAHEQLVSLVSREQQLISAIKQYQEYRVHGVRYAVDIPYYEQCKAKKAKQQKEHSTLYGSSTYGDDYNSSNGMLSFNNNDSYNGSAGKLPPLPSNVLTATGTASNGRDSKNEIAELDKARPSFDLAVMPGNELLSMAEFDLCSELHLIPKHYFLLKHTIVRLYVSKSTVSFKLVRQAIPRVDGKLLTKVYEFIVAQGWVSASEQTAAQALVAEQQVRGDVSQYQALLQLHQQQQQLNDNKPAGNVQPIVATVLSQS